MASHGTAPGGGAPTSEDERRIRLEHHDLLAMHLLAPLISGYLPWTTSAMRPSGIVAVLNEIVLNRRRRIVELGGGISTYFIARMLADRGGHLWTVEHDDGWADVLREKLARQGVDGSVTLVHAPLTPIEDGWPGEESRWYDRGRLREIAAGGPVDLLIIDGPPAYLEGQEHSRYPAVPYFAPLLADDYTIILDDIDRCGEQDIVQRWEREFGTVFEVRYVRGRIGVHHSRPAYTI